jgi:hypothetical protein
VLTEYRAILLASSTNLDDLKLYQAQEETTPEGSLISLELHFDDYPDAQALGELNQKCLDAGVLPWFGNTQIVFTHPNTTIVTLQWTKEFAWLPIIIGLVATTILPVLLGAVVWWLIPEDVKNMITSLVTMMVMFFMIKMITPMFTPAEKPKQIEGAKS